MRHSDPTHPCGTEEPVRPSHRPIEAEAVVHAAPKGGELDKRLSMEYQKTTQKTSETSVGSKFKL